MTVIQKLAVISAAATRSGARATAPRIRFAALALAAALSAPFAVSAAGSDELWEVTTQMNIPGMPAGGQTSQVCRDKDLRKADQGRDKDCTITDLKQSGTHTTIRMSCPGGDTMIEQDFNASRTEYKGTITMSRGGKRQMVMNTSGRKIGSCDAQQARSEMAGKAAAAKAQGEDYKRQADAALINACNQAADGMNAGQFGVYGPCRGDPATCTKIKADVAKNQPAVASTCSAKVAEFCTRYQTQEGFARAKASKDGADLCGLNAAKVKASLCPNALRTESLGFLGSYCPAEAKTLAQKECVGRDYTSMTGKYRGFCSTYLASAQEAEEAAEPAAGRARPAARGEDSGQRQTSAQPQPPQNAGDAAKQAIDQGIGQGLNKLKGLFGR